VFAGEERVKTDEL